MNAAQARALILLRDQQSSWVPNRTEAELALHAGVLATYLEDAPASWATRFVMDGAARGHVPTDAEIVAAWRRERVPADVRARIDAPAPQPPRAVAEDVNLSLRWNRARVAALIDGASEGEAVAAANDALGVEPDPDPVGVDVAALVAELRDTVGALTHLRMPGSDDAEGAA